MKYTLKNSFIKSLKGLNSSRKQQIKDLVLEVVAILSSGEKPSKGHGLTRLRVNYWEARANIRDRILFELEDDFIVFILAGSHDDVKKFLKNL